MRTGKANVVAPLTSLEEPPATSCAAVSFSSPVRAEGESQTWAAPCLGRASVCFAGRRFFGPAHQ